MPKIRRIHAAFAGLALAGLAVAACGPEKPLAVAPSKPPEISLAPRIIDQAGAYRNFIDRASSISPSFSDGEMVSKAVEAGSSIEAVRESNKSLG